MLRPTDSLITLVTMHASVILTKINKINSAGQMLLPLAGYMQCAIYTYLHSG